MNTSGFLNLFYCIYLVLQTCQRVLISYNDDRPHKISQKDLFAVYGCFGDRARSSQDCNRASNGLCKAKLSMAEAFLLWIQPVKTGFTLFLAPALEIDWGRISGAP